MTFEPTQPEFFERSEAYEHVETYRGYDETR